MHIHRCLISSYAYDNNIFGRLMRSVMRAFASHSIFSISGNCVFVPTKSCSIDAKANANYWKFPHTQKFIRFSFRNENFLQSIVLWNIWQTRSDISKSFYFYLMKTICTQWTSFNNQIMKWFLMTFLSYITWFFVRFILSPVTIIVISQSITFLFTIRFMSEKYSTSESSQVVDCHMIFDLVFLYFFWLSQRNRNSCYELLYVNCSRHSNEFEWIK